MSIDRVKMWEKAAELLDGQVGITAESKATNRVAGAIILHGLLTSEQSVTVSAQPAHKPVYGGLPRSGDGA